MSILNSLELLAPAGSMEKLKIALAYGADAVYLAGKNYGLRAFSDNFDLEQLKSAFEYLHKNNKKGYVTLNIYAYDVDFLELKDYLCFLASIKVDGLIISDIGIMEFVKTHAPALDIHLSTQANTTNKYSAKFWASYGVKRIVTARELSLEQISDMRDALPDSVVIESFVHGAMCISYSGRCLLSNFMANRVSNHGECAQSCRWEYTIAEVKRNEQMPIEEDCRGTYILNSRDLNMIEHMDKLVSAGVTSFKIEGRVKSAYYVASTVNAYNRALEILKKDNGYNLPMEIKEELIKTSHRKYCTGFYLGDTANNECYDSARPEQEYDFIAIVTSNFQGGAIIEQRNRFSVGDELEILSPGNLYNEKFIVEKMESLEGEPISTANVVQQKIKLYTNLALTPNDIIRKKNK